MFEVANADDDMVDPGDPVAHRSAPALAPPP
jgi:hypothetical protein